MTGERGPTGDHGQQGPPGLEGARGARGASFSRTQTLALFLFVVMAFIVLAVRSEHQTRQASQNLTRQRYFVQEVCARHPDYAPISCGQFRP